MFKSKLLIGTEVVTNASGSKLRLVFKPARAWRKKKLYIKLTA